MDKIRFNELDMPADYFGKVISVNQWRFPRWDRDEIKSEFWIVGCSIERRWSEEGGRTFKSFFAKFAWREVYQRYIQFVRGYSASRLSRNEDAETTTNFTDEGDEFVDSLSGRSSEDGHEFDWSLADTDWLRDDVYFYLLQTAWGPRLPGRSTVNWRHRNWMLSELGIEQ